MNVNLNEETELSTERLISQNLIRCAMSREAARPNPLIMGRLPVSMCVYVMVCVLSQGNFTDGMGRLERRYRKLHVAL